MNLAYLTTMYPSASHTFIRREILELEQRGHVIHRFSIRRSNSIVDTLDKEEEKKTFYCLEQSIYRILKDSVTVFFRHPKKWFEAFFLTLKLSKQSERGLIRHCAYLVEASILSRELEEKSIKHIHVHFGTNATAVALLIKKLSGITYSFTVHGPGEFDAPIGFSLGRKIEEAKFVIAISHYGAAQLKRWISFKHWEKIHIVRCVIDDHFFSSESIKLDESNKNLICVGRLAPQKGHLVLLDAVKILKNRNIEINLLLIGDGEMRSIIEDRIKTLELNDNVSITGWATGEQVRQYLLESKSLILPSFAEGLPVAIMEAFALSRPVITTCIAGIPELVKQGENGWLVTANDAEALAEALISLLKTPIDELNKMGEKARDDVRRLHYVVDEVAKLEKLFISTIQ